MQQELTRVDQLLDRAASCHPEHVAVVDEERRITFKELRAGSETAANALRLMGFSAGQRAGILCTNSIEYVIIFFAALKAGLVVVPLDTSLNARSLAGILADCQISLLFSEGRFRKVLHELLAVDSSVTTLVCDGDLKIGNPLIQVLKLETLLGKTGLPEGRTPGAPARNVLSRDGIIHELAAIFYTSGSTGASKGVMLSHRNLISNTLATCEYLHLADHDSVLVILPFYYIYGNSLLLTHIAIGGRLVLDNRFMYPEVILDTLEKERATGFSGVPSNFMILLNNSTFTSRRLESLRYLTQAGGAMAPEVTRRLMDAFPNKQIFIMYGQTEAAPRVTYLPPERLAEKLGSIGLPVPGVTVTIRDENDNELPVGEVGELTVTGDNVMMGYWNQPDEDRLVLKNSSLFTGDLARKDSDGYLYIVGRKKEIIKAGGNRVSAKEIEECLLANEKIAEACVIGIADDVLGEAIRAVIVLKDGVVADPKEIQLYCRRRLADFKVPKQILFLDALPKYQSGKVNKILLKDDSLCGR